MTNLALNGGPKLRTKPWPERNQLSDEEKKEILNIVDKSLETGQPIIYNDEYEKKYCNEFAELLGGGFADAVNSGTNALFVALHALNPEPLTEIIVGAVTDAGGVMPIPLLNCIPVFADTMEDSYNTNLEQIKKRITEHTSIIIVPHISGEPAEIDKIVEFAHSKNIPVIEDCSQAHGAKLNGKPVGTFGDIAIFSTMYGKHICTGGQGGIIFTKDEKLYHKILQCSDRGKPFGLEKGSTNCIATLNCNLDELSAAIGSVQIHKLPNIIENRINFVSALKKLLTDVKCISFPEFDSSMEPSYWFLRVKFDSHKINCNKQKFCSALYAEGVKVNENYRAALPMNFDWFKNKKVFGTSNYPWGSPEYKGDYKELISCPNAEKAMNDFFNLEISESWGEDESKDLANCIIKVNNCFSN